MYNYKTQQNIRAFRLSEIEVGNTPTPESYTLLPYSYLKEQEKGKSLNIDKRYIEGKIFELMVLYQNLEIYKETGKKEKVKSIKE